MSGRCHTHSMEHLVTFWAKMTKTFDCTTHSMFNHYLTELKTLKSDFFKTYGVNDFDPLENPIVQEIYF